MFLFSSLPLYSSIPFPLFTSFPSTPPQVPFFFFSSLFLNTFSSIYSISFYSISHSFFFFSSLSSIPFPLFTPFLSSPPQFRFFFFSSLFFNTYSSIYFFSFSSISLCFPLILNFLFNLAFLSDMYLSLQK